MNTENIVSDSGGRSLKAKWLDIVLFDDEVMNICILIDARQYKSLLFKKHTQKRKDNEDVYYKNRRLSTVEGRQ